MLNAYNIILMIACYFTSNIIFAPTLPHITSYFGSPEQLVKATMVFYQFGALISCIIAALFADYLGKKNFLVFGLTVAIIGSLICYLSPTIEVLIMGRFIQGFGGAAGFMMGFALATDLFEYDVTLRIIGLNGVITALAGTVSPYVGGAISENYSWRDTFLVVISLFAITLLVSYFRLPPESNIRKPQLEMGRSLKEVLTIITSRKYLAYATLNGILITGFIFSVSFIPFYFGSAYGLNSTEIGLMIGLAMWLTFGIASQFSTHLYKAIGVVQGVRLALFITLMGGILMAVDSTFGISDSSLVIAIFALIIYCVGFGLLYAGSISESMHVFMELTTKASAIRTVMLTVGSLVGAVSSEHMDGHVLGSFAFMLIAISVSAIFMFSIRGKS